MKFESLEEEARYNELLANWDGWGSTPTESILFHRAMRKKEILDRLLRDNATGWRATYKDIQGKNKYVTHIENSTQEEAYNLAVEEYGEPDNWNTFIHLDPIVPNYQELWRKVYSNG